MTNIPQWKRAALQAIDLALVAMPEISAARADLEFAKSHIANCGGLNNLPNGSADSLINLLHEISDHVLDDGRDFTAAAIDRAVKQLTVAIEEHEGV